jgi:uncharacterized protein involved in response to NO
MACRVPTSHALVEKAALGLPLALLAADTLHSLLRGLVQAGWVMPSVATHALTVNAAGGLIVGRVTRTARGHTGRPLQADPCDMACYLLMSGAAVVRMFIPLALPAWTMPAVQCSAALWSAGFGLYAIRYWPMLSRPRLDSKPGWTK